MPRWGARACHQKKGLAYSSGESGQVAIRQRSEARRVRFGQAVILCFLDLGKPISERSGDVWREGVQEEHGGGKTLEQLNNVGKALRGRSAWCLRSQTTRTAQEALVGLLSPRGIGPTSTLVLAIARLTPRLHRERRRISSREKRAFIGQQHVCCTFKEGGRGFGAEDRQERPPTPRRVGIRRTEAGQVFRP